jgi:hypothetical protein
VGALIAIVFYLGAVVLGVLVAIPIALFLGGRVLKMKRPRKTGWMAATALWFLVLILAVIQPYKYLAVTAALCVASLFEAFALVVLIWRSDTRRRRLTLGAILIAGLIVCLPGVTLYSWSAFQFGAAAVSCGHAPVIATDELSFSGGGARAYTQPGDDGYTPSGLSDHYYCSAYDAERAGYTRNGT